MTTETDALLSIGEVSGRTGLPTHTLRFYEQEGLFAFPVRRNAAGRRLYTEEQAHWARVCTKLRSSGMPLPEIHRYVALVREGPGNEKERFAILREHEEKVAQQVAALQEALRVIQTTVEIYEEALAAGTADALWRDGPTCD